MFKFLLLVTLTSLTVLASSAYAAPAGCAIFPVKTGGSDLLPIYDYGLYVGKSVKTSEANSEEKYYKFKLFFQNKSYSVVKSKSDQLVQSGVCAPIPYCMRLPLYYGPGLLYCIARRFL